MTIVEGQIESLKQLKVILNQNGITRFNSIGEINKFIENYDFEKNKISKDIEQTLDIEINDLQSELIKLQQVYDKLKAEITNEVNIKINDNKDKLNLVKEKSKKNIIKKILLFPQLRILKLEKSNLEKNYEKIIRRKTYIAEREVIITKKKIDDYSENKEKIILERSSLSQKKLAFTKEVVDGLYTFKNKWGQIELPPIKRMN